MARAPIPSVPLHPLRPHGAAVTDLVFWLHPGRDDAHDLGLAPRPDGMPPLLLDVSGDGFALADVPLDLDTPASGVCPRTAARVLADPGRHLELNRVGAVLQARIVDGIEAADAAVAAAPGLDDAARKRFAEASAETTKKLDRYFAAATERFPRRLIVVAEPAAMVDDTPWEALQWASRPGQRANPAIVNGGVQLVRCDPSAQTGFGTEIDGRLRVLLLIGSLDQGESQDSRERTPAAVAQAIHAALAELRELVDLTVVVTQGRVDDLVTDVPVASLAEVHNLLTADPGWHVVHLVAHGTVADEAGRGEATFTLRLPAPDGERLEDQPFHTRDLKLALEATPTRVLVLSACTSGGAVASALLSCADHVAAMAGKVDPQCFAPSARGLYGALAAAQSMGRAMQAARAEIGSFASRTTLQHWARTLDPRPLVDPLRLREKHYRRFCELSHRSLFGPMMDDLVPDRADLLGDLFVELQLEDATRDARAEQLRVAALPEAQRLRRALDPRLRPEAVPETRAPLHRMLLHPHRRFVVLADPGAGKTTTLRQLARRFAHDQERLPVYLHLSRWRPRAEDGRMPTLDEQLEALRPGLAEVFWAADRRKRALLLIDGIDEYADAARLQELLEWLHVEVQSTIVVTSRWVGYRAQAVPPEFWRLRILSLNDRGVDEREVKRQLLRRWFTARGVAEPENRAEQTLAKLTGHLRTFTDTPLLLHLVAWLDERGKELGRMRHEVYRHVVDAVVAGEHRGPRADRTDLPAVARDVLRSLALHLSRHGKTHEARDALCQAVLGQGHRRAAELAREVKLWRSDPRQVLEDLGRETGLVRPREGFATTDAEWGFWIKPFQDALVGEYLFFEVYEPAARDSAAPARRTQKSTKGARPSPPAGQAAVLAFLLSADAGRPDQREEAYGEAAALLTGWIPEAERQAWVTILLTDASLGLQAAGVRAIAYLGEVATALVAKVLRQLGNGDERARFYRRVVELAADGAVAARTLGACSRAVEARAFRDLYEIDTLLLEVRDDPSDPNAARVARNEHAQLLERWGDGAQRQQVRAAFARLADGSDPWCEIRAGWYRRGSPEDEGRDSEHPALPVHLTKPFVIGATTITQEQYALFDPSHRHRWPGHHMPVTSMNWYAATMFARWLGHHLGVEGRLPTEAEWEYACRGQRCESAEAVRRASWPPYWCGDLTEAVAWFGKGLEGRPRPTHEGDPNPFGLRNVHGNVWDWRGPYQADPDGTNTDPTGPSSGSVRLLRGGGCWGVADFCRSAYRNADVPAFVNDVSGFRVVLSARPGP